MAHVQKRCGSKVHASTHRALETLKGFKIWNEWLIKVNFSIEESPLSCWGRIFIIIELLRISSWFQRFYRKSVSTNLRCNWRSQDVQSVCWIQKAVLIQNWSRLIGCQIKTNEGNEEKRGEPNN